jgi:hypothetical protein
LIRIADAKPFSLSKYSAELNLIEQIFAELNHSPRDAAAYFVKASTHYRWNMSRDSRGGPFVWTRTRVLQGRGRITQL